VQVQTADDLRVVENVSHAVFGPKASLSKADLERELGQCTGPEATIARFYVTLDGEPVSAGGITLHPAFALGFLWAGGTREAFRGRGAYSALVAARVAWARSRGADVVGLYARVDTSAPIMARQGFASYGTMDHWMRW